MKLRGGSQRACGKGENATFDSQEEKTMTISGMDMQRKANKKKEGGRRRGEKEKKRKKKKREKSHPAATKAGSGLGGRSSRPQRLR